MKVQTLWKLKNRGKEISFASIRYVRGATTLLHRICHQILAAYEAENGNVVVFVKNS